MQRIGAIISSYCQNPASGAARENPKLLRLSFVVVMILGIIAAAQAQQPGKTFRIAVLTYDQSRPNAEPFFDELNRLGYIAEQNAKIELWNAEGRADKLAELAEEVSRFK